MLGPYLGVPILSLCAQGSVTLHLTPAQRHFEQQGLWSWDLSCGPAPLCPLSGGGLGHLLA